LFTIYEAINEGRTPDLSPVRPYRDYIEWSQKQDLNRAEQYWRARLGGFTKPTPLAGVVPGNRPIPKPDYDREGFVRLDYTRQVEYYPAATTAALGVLARQNNLTLNTLVQGAWALLLMRYNGSIDVLYGSITSARAAELAGLELTVGSLNNLLPTRVKAETA